MIKHKLVKTCLIVLTSGLFSGMAMAADEPVPAQLAFDKEITPLLQKYCYQCHGSTKPKADLSLESYQNVDQILKDRAKWELVLRNIQSREMPPEDAKAQPTQAERDIITAWVQKELFAVDPKNPDPGRVTIRRLNRAEYTNTIRDLVGVDFQANADFPPDDAGYGFDNNGDVLSLPPVLMEKYLSAADKILDEAISTEPVRKQTRRFPASLAQIGFNAIGDRGDGWIQLISLEEDDVAVELPTSAGDYLVRVYAFCKPTGGAMVGGGNNNRQATSGPVDPTKISVMLNNAFVQDFELSTDETKAGVYEARVGVPAGKNRFRAVMRRTRGGANELTMINGRIGKQQPGIGYVKWIEIEGPLPAATRRIPAARLEATGDSHMISSGARLLDHEGEVSTKFTVNKDGEYTLRAQAFADQAGDWPAQMELRVDGKPVQVFDVLAGSWLQPLKGQRVFSISLLVPEPKVYEIKVPLAPGEHRFAAAFINDHVDPENQNPNLRDRNLYIDNLEVVNPYEPALQPEMPAKIRELFAKGAQNPRELLSQFTRRAWRRPVQNDELDRLVSLFDLASKQGESFEGSIKIAMKGALVSPNFLFRGEIQPDPHNPKAVHPINELALASRLSYFLWSSMPDDELLGLAEKGELKKNLTAQVQRMLASPKALSLVSNFATQWLQTRSMDTLQPDKELFPNYDPQMRLAMQKETELFFENVMREDRSVMDFLTGDYTFVNERLAKYYGIENVKGDVFQKISLAGTPRRGVLTQASVLTLTSNPTRTSPVKRGKWVLENLLNTPPPPPPPNVPPLEKEGQKATGTLRQQMEQHREDPTCAGCHARMDPIGFGLENFDAVGAWREKDGEASIDASGKLVSGESFNGAVELANILATQKRQEFLNCLADRMLTYGLGRGLEYYDRPAVEQIAKGMEASDYKFSSLILGVVNSLPFQMQRGENQQTASAR